MDWGDVSFVISSKARKAVLTALQTEKTPTLLARELHTSLPNISRALRELRAKGLIELVTPGTRTGKIYRATPGGKEVLRSISEMEDK